MRGRGRTYGPDMRQTRRLAATWRIAAGATAVLLLLSVPPAAALDEPPSTTVPAAGDDGTTTTTTGPAVSLPPPTVSAPPAPSVTTPSAPPSDPASATPAPETTGSTETVVGTLEPDPGPDPHPLPVTLATASADVTGALGVAADAAELASARVTTLETQVAAAAAALATARAERSSDELHANDAARRASGSSTHADDARRAAIATATESLLTSRTSPDPATELAVRGEVDPDDLWAHGLRQALAAPVAERVERTRSTAEVEHRRARSAADALETAGRRVDELAAELDRLRGALEQARVAQAAAGSQVAAARASTVAALSAGEVTPDAQRVSVLDIPTRTLDAYLLAERRLAAESPACRMRWWVVAGIGAVESGHGTFRGAYPSSDGVVRPLIIGPRLDGGAFARIGDTDGGRLDGDDQFDHAVGPMQFIPSTWASSGRDGDGDGVSDPHNVYDAAYAAAAYLCRGARGAAVDTADGFAAAAWSYNRSRPYGTTTWQRAVAYSSVAPRVVGGRSDAP